MANVSIAGMQTPSVEMASDASQQSTSTAQVQEQEDNTVPATTREKVKEYFDDAPIMYQVARCESTWRQYDQKTGKVLRGNVDANDVGVMQINERYHLDQSESLGYDIHTLEGNMKYARYLYRNQGLQPWSASKPCWSRARQIAQK